MATRPETILHCDMDAFFASVEQRDAPELRGKPVVVGGAGPRSVVAAASYEARRFGVRSAMPMVRARRLCPGLVIVLGHHERYADVSRDVMAVFESFTPHVEPLSLDEAFLDVSGATRLFGTPTEIAQQIRERIRTDLDLPCSVGIGPTKFVAKLLSDRAKPDGIAHWSAEEVVTRLRPLPIGDLWGAGPKTVERLARFGFKTVGDIADSDAATITRIAGSAVGETLYALAHGRDARRVEKREAAGRSAGAEQTYTTDLTTVDDMRLQLRVLADRIGRRLRADNDAGRTVTLKVRFSTFETITRSLTLTQATNSTHDLAAVATELLDRLRLERAHVRLLGISISNLAPAGAAGQLSFDDDSRWSDIDDVADTVADKFAGLGLTVASMLDPDASARNEVHTPTAIKPDRAP